jgi:hypothetical protein
MTRALLLLSLLCGGCLVVPAKKTTSRPGGEELGAKTFATARSVELTAKADEASIFVHAIRHGECTQPVYAVTEITSERKAKFRGVEDPRGALFGFLLAPITIPVSALVTGLMVAGDDAVTTKQTRPIGTKRFACSEEAEHLAVQVTLPSGAVVYGVTDNSGDARIEVPTSEPYSGSVTLAAQGAEPTQLAYSLPRPAVMTARDAVQECAAANKVVGRLELKLTINDRGFPTRLWLSAGNADVNTCVSQRVAGKQFPEKMWGRTIKMGIDVAGPAAASL